MLLFDVNSFICEFMMVNLRVLCAVYMCWFVLFVVCSHCGAKEIFFFSFAMCNENLLSQGQR